MSAARDFDAKPGDDKLVELMAEAAYERSRTGTSSRPAWAECTDFWREASRREMAAAVAAARRAGYRIEKGS